MTDLRLPCQVETVSSPSAVYDGLVVVSPSIESLTGNVEFVRTPLVELKQLDQSVGNSPTLVPCPGHVLKRVVFSPTGPLNRDYDDVRIFGEAANAGIKRAIQAGFKSPLLYTVPYEKYKDATLVSLLGALHALYVPIEVREDVPARATKVNKLGLWTDTEAEGKTLIDQGLAIESGRLVCRDIGGSDPERMAPNKVATYVESVFEGSRVEVNIISDVKVINKDYPLFAAVNRCASLVDRHRGRIVKLLYTGEGEIKNTLLLVGKGVTYDTGGADIKAGGVMAGMHRDKCGAAFVAGFFQVLNKLQPKNIKVIGTMAMVRNSVGAESYVADEIITSRAGVRVRVGNTDAEGRMAMADVLCEMKELAAKEVNPHIMTIATLTGHAIRAVGPNYSIIMDNGPAQQEQFAQAMQKSGHDIADPFEISTLRRDDYLFSQGKSEYEDVLQCNNQSSSNTARGHQFPGAFMILASGMDKHGGDSASPLKYSHIDIAGSSGPFPGIPTGAPIPAFTAKYLI